MIVCKNDFCERGASMVEVVLSIAVIVAVAPFIYNQITEMSNSAKDIAMANQIVGLRDGVINFIRIHQNEWDDVAEIKMNNEQIQEIVPSAHSGFIDRYKINGANVSDVYLAFSLPESNYRVSNIVKQIGEDAAIVREDGIAYSQNWAVSAPEDFNTGDLIYRISYDFTGNDKSRFLHRGTMGEDGLNQMQRNLHMNNYDVFNIGDIDSLTAKITDVDAVFLESDVVDANTIYFSSGANMNSANVVVGSMRVTGDTNGFKKISADKLNGDKYTTSGRLIVDRATIGNSVNVAGNLILKSLSANNVSGFGGISTNKLLTPYISTTDMVFYENFGITVSGELLLSGVAPLKIGNWSWPSKTPPAFSKFILTRATLSGVPDISEFKELTDKDWQTR